MSSKRKYNRKRFVPYVLNEELDQIESRRAHHGLLPHTAATNAATPTWGATGRPPRPNGRVNRATGDYARAHLLRPFGVALSGGGIRSATFNLGLLQAIAERGLLPYMDYLSTVSGGGYIGSWLHGLLKRDAVPKTEQDLSPRLNPIPDTPEKDSVSFLRKYSNYLAPKLGLFSSDTWVIGLIWVRNVLLNQLVLIPAVMCVFALLFAAGFVQQMKVAPAISQGFPLAGVAASAVGAALLLALNLQRVIQPKRVSTGWMRALESNRAAELIVPLMLTASFLLACADIGRELQGRVVAAVFLAGGFFALHIWGGFRQCYFALHSDSGRFRVYATLHAVWMPLVATAFCFGLLLAYWNWSAAATAWAVLTFGPLITTLILGASTSLLIGLMGSDYPDAAREWTAATGATLFRYASLWTGVAALAIYGPWIVSSLLARFGEYGSTLVWGWLLTSAGGVIAGRSPKSTGTGSNQNTNPVIQLLVGMAPTVFMIGYLTLISAALHSIFRSMDLFSSHARPATGGQGWFQKQFGPFASDYFHILDVTTTAGNDALDWQRLHWLLAIAAAAAVISFVASRRININEFSIHHFYKNRLVRAYLGASNNRDRRPNSLTGFDPTDDFPVASLLTKPRPGKNFAPYYGPFAIINTAINLNTGSELAQQERKAASFVFTPLYSGFEPIVSEEDIRAAWRGGPALRGYRPTDKYGYGDGPSLGTTMSISGAAANPNSGYHTSGPMAFLLTVFNVRLGWWMHNPRMNEEESYPGPRFALWYLFAELFGLTNSRTEFVNLSDGGHFDNIGVYELIRRRCRYIIVGDGEEDRKLSFESLGGAIRKCRADFGVEIDIDPTPIKMHVGGFSKVHCVVGTIYYPERESSFCTGVCSGEQRAPTENTYARGWILYVKSSLTGDEPHDVIEYRSRCPNFPHESTGDQFFSESQFESYRRLGLHAGRDAFEDLGVTLQGNAETDMLGIFQALAKKWYSPVPVPDEAASRLANDYARLVSRLGSDVTLSRVFGALLRPDAPPAPKPRRRLNDSCYSFGLELLQLMENVFTEFHLEHGNNAANPRNTGWIQTFRRWVKCPALYEDVWGRARNDYNPIFRDFVEELRKTEDFDVCPRL